MTKVFTFGARSEAELVGVKPQLVAVCRRALELSQIDFGCHDGKRTRAEQKALVAAGASQTLNSKHLTGDAVDLVPYVNGKLRWEWPPIYVVASAVRLAAQELDVRLRWGGVWDVLDFTASTAAPSDMVANYVARRRRQGQQAFIDGPHFELS